MTPGHQTTAHRRRTDLVPTLTMRREPDQTTPRRSPGRARSLGRLETLARPRLSVASIGAKSMQHLAVPPTHGQGGQLATNLGARARARTVGARETRGRWDQGLEGAAIDLSKTFLWEQLF